MKGQGNDGGKMVTLGKVFSLATPLGAIMGKFWLLWVYKSLENKSAAIVDLKMLSDTDARTKVRVLLCRYLYILRTRNYIHLDIYT